MKIIIDNKIPFIQGALEPFAEVVYLPGAEISAADVKDADAMIVRTRTKCNAALLDGSKVKFIATATIGFDHIDAGYCEKNNIIWTSAPGCNSFSVQQYIASTLLNIANDEVFSLKDKTLGIVGVGNVGSKVAKFAETMGMKVLLNDPPLQAGLKGELAGSLDFSMTEAPGPSEIDSAGASVLLNSDSQVSSIKHQVSNQFVSLEQIKNESDFITFHVPLNREGEYSTFHMVDETFLCDVRNSTWIFNSSRGEVVDNAAIKQALQDKKIAGAVLDVWENEPQINLELMKLAKFATPHIAGYSADGKANGTSMSVQVLSKFFGLEIDDWQAESVPVPEGNTLTIDCENKTLEDVMSTAILATYDIKGDDGRLRNSPETFEKQRGDYPLRREPLAFKIELVNDSANFAESLNEMRFHLMLDA